MADSVSKAKRSYIMSRIRGKDTKPEKIVRSALFAAGLRFRLHDKTLPGKPDIVLKRYMTAILVHGCFWHAHSSCKAGTIPKTRTEWWAAKLARNKANDSRNIRRLRKLGWRVLVIWECDLHPRKRQATMKKLISSLKMKLIS